MSEIQKIDFNLERAIKFNLAYTNEKFIPDKAFEKYPGLSKPRDQREFSEAVRDFQDSLDDPLIIVDGMLGNKTWLLLCKKFDNVTGSYLLHQGRRLALEDTQGVEYLPYDDKVQGIDLHPGGHFNKRNPYQIDLIVVHWGGINIKNCKDALNSRGLSSHFGIEGNKVYQWLDTQHCAWHGGKVNNRSIGIDICQYPTTDWQSYYKKRGLSLSIVDNKTGRGDKKVLSLAKDTAQATRELIKQLCKLYHIPYRFPMTSDVVSHAVQKDLDQFQGVIGHHHVSPQKWDIACWWDQIFI
jgi:hypothetical protein